MSYDFNADEIFEMAKQLERNGADFYRRAADSVSSEAHKKMLRRLADMEVEHEKTFEAMHGELTAQEKESTVFDPMGEGAQYLKALVDTQVFFEKEIDTASIQDILKAAIQAEKDSIVFYLGMQEAVPLKRGKQRLEAIVKEEMGHIRLLGKELVASR